MARRQGYDNRRESRAAFLARRCGPASLEASPDIALFSATYRSYLYCVSFCAVTPLQNRELYGKSIIPEGAKNGMFSTIC